LKAPTKLSYRFQDILCEGRAAGSKVWQGKPGGQGRRQLLLEDPTHTHWAQAGRQAGPGGSRVAKVFDVRCDVTRTCQGPNRVDHAPALDQLVEKGEEVHDS
jgi:hypothetical protein